MVEQKCRWRHWERKPIGDTRFWICTARNVCSCKGIGQDGLVNTLSVQQNKLELKISSALGFFATWSSWYLPEQSHCWDTEYISSRYWGQPHPFPYFLMVSVQNFWPSSVRLTEFHEPALKEQVPCLAGKSETAHYVLSWDFLNPPLLIIYSCHQDLGLQLISINLHTSLWLKLDYSCNSILNLY